MSNTYYRYSYCPNSGLIKESIVPEILIKIAMEKYLDTGICKHNYHVKEKILINYYDKCPVCNKYLIDN